MRRTAIQRLGIFGGTFDPVHHGHLRTALEVSELLALDELRLVPASVPPHRGAPVATSAERLRMLQLAADACPGFVVDDIELQRGGASYTIDTLRSVRAEVGADAHLCLLIGIDAFARLDTWKEWQQLVDHAHVMVLQRPGVEPEIAPVVAQWAAARLQPDPLAAFEAAPAGTIARVEFTQLAISATQIRRLLAVGRSPRYLMPDAVLDYIRENRIYDGVDTHPGGR